MRERSLSAVPKPALLLLAAGLCAQLLWHFSHPPAPATAASLPAAPSLSAVQLASLGEPIALSKILLLYVQGFDDQPGVQAPFRRLDFERVTGWLGLTLQLDPRGQYPLFLASRVYGEVGDPVKQRIMAEFVYQAFSANPNQRWDALANVAITTRHRIGDIVRAERYARALREQATGPDVPDWARQMDIFMLADMHDYERALQLLDGLIQGGQISDINELRLLRERRERIASEAANRK